MSTVRKYFWKDNNGKIRVSTGIELTDSEKGELARKNMKLIRSGECWKYDTKREG